MRYGHIGFSVFNDLISKNFVDGLNVSPKKLGLCDIHMCRRIAVKRTFQWNSCKSVNTEYEVCSKSIENFVFFQKLFISS